MAEKDPRLTADIARIDEWLSDLDASFDDLRADFPFLRSAAEARQFLQEIREGLASAERGELFTTEEVMRELEARRRSRRSAAE